MHRDIVRMISECPICQKLKIQREANREDTVDHHLYSLDPLTSLSVDTLGSLKEDESGNSFIFVIFDNFSSWTVSGAKYDAQGVRSGTFTMSIFEIRSDGCSQFTSLLSFGLCSLMSFHQFVVLAYHPQANGLVETNLKSS